MSTITVEQYSEKAIVVRGNTVPYKDKLLSIGGKWNKMLKGGEGWIFPLTKKHVVEKMLSEPPSVHDNDNESNNDVDNSSVKKKDYVARTSRVNSNMSSSEIVLTKKEYLHLISRIERLEQLVGDNNISSNSSSTKQKNIPPPLSSINDNDICDPEYMDEPEEREPIQRLMMKKKKNNV